MIILYALFSSPNTIRLLTVIILSPGTHTSYILWNKLEFKFYIIFAILIFAFLCNYPVLIFTLDFIKTSIIIFLWVFTLWYFLYTLSSLLLSLYLIASNIKGITKKLNLKKNGILSHLTEFRGKLQTQLVEGSNSIFDFLKSALFLVLASLIVSGWL